MTRCIKGATALVVALFITMVFSTAATAQSIPYDRGQNVAPIYEGWQRGPNGTIVMLFGYLNRNYQELIDIPVGPNNFFEPGPADRGQPTHFLLRRQPFVLSVTLPNDWDAKARLTWTLTANGKTATVQGWLAPEWYADDGIIQNVLVGGAPGTAPKNERPTIVGSPAQTVALPNTITVRATVTDDGMPKPRARTAGRRTEGADGGKAPGLPGVTVRWIHYRGPGIVTFTQPATVGEYGKPVEAVTTVSFSAPSTYVIRAIASDGLFETFHDITVTVK